MKQRFITALILLIVLIPIVVLGGIPYYIAISIISMMGLSELIRIIDKDKKMPLIIKLFSYVLVTLITINNLFTVADSFKLSHIVIALTLFFLLIPIIFFDKKKYNINDALFLISSVIFLGVAFNLFITTRNIGLGYFFFLIGIPIITDSFAYFTGMLIGKNKMAPTISPKKTWEGFFGGLIFTVVMMSSIYSVSFGYEGNIIFPILVISLLSIVGQLGDLVFSSIKRYYDIKDFSNLLPGHGGVLDRVDSMIFVLLTFSLISSFII